MGFPPPSAPPVPLPTSSVSLPPPPSLLSLRPLLSLHLPSPTPFPPPLSTSSSSDYVLLHNSFAVFIAYSVWLIATAEGAACLLLCRCEGPFRLPSATNITGALLPNVHQRSPLTGGSGSMHHHRVSWPTFCSCCSMVSVLSWGLLQDLWKSVVLIVTWDCRANLWIPSIIAAITSPLYRYIDSLAPSQEKSIGRLGSGLVQHWDLRLSKWIVKRMGGLCLGLEQQER